MTIDQYVKKQLESIQSRYNFSPTDSIKQVPDHSEYMVAYGRFKELCNIIKKLKLDFKIPYDPSGLTPLQHLAKIKVRKTYVYFSRKENTTIWKLGSSIYPTKRTNSVQTGNDSTLELVYEAEAPRVVERNLKKYLRKFKTRDKNNTVKGEWFNLPPETVKDIVQQIKSGETFANLKPLKAI